MPALDPGLDLSAPRRILVVGAGGSGMSAIATVLAAMGHHVTASDQAWSPALRRLEETGIPVTIGHGAAAAGVVGADAVAVSTAIPADNPEVTAARAAGVPVVRRAEALAALCASRRTVAVSGTHGKTTTTALLALVLREAGMDPAFIVGGDVVGLGGGAAWGDAPSGWFVVEADESDGTFVELAAEVVVLTSVEADHLDFHGSFDQLRQSFARFLAQAPGPRVVCVDDPEVRRLTAQLDCVTYGLDDDADFRLVDLVSGRDGVAFDLTRDGQRLGRLQLPLPGTHNARNAAAATVTALLLGASFGAARAALADFAGVGRRYERRGEANGVTFIDDYAHLPGEVVPALDAARSGRWERVVCVFQPHRYTRTAALAPSFADAFLGADVIAVTDVYPAGQVPLPGVSGKLVLDAVLDAHPFQRAAWLPRRQDLVTWLLAELRPGDLCLTLGAGDLTTLPDDVLAVLRRQR